MANIFKAKTLVSRTGIFSHEVIAPNLVYNTGDQNISGNKNFLNNIGVSGTGVFSAIDLNNIDTLSLSGVNISIVDGTISLTNRPNVNGTGVVLSGELNSTGIFLNNKINSLSGYVNSQDLIFSGQIASTGSNLTNSINSLSGASVLLYGNQTISGIKTFAENAVFGDPSQGDFLVISGNTFTIYGSGNFTSGLFVNGNAVLTGVDLSSSSSNIVFTTGNQTINGLKTFTSGIDIYSGTSPQSLRIFNSTGTNSGEFALIGWQRNAGIVSPTTNALVIGTQASNAGILRDLIITGENIALSPRSGRLYINGTVSLNDNLLQTSQCSGNITGYITGIGFTGNYTGNYEGGYFLGRTKITQNTVQLVDSSFGSNYVAKTAPAPNQIFNSAAVSSDGRYQIITSSNGYIYVSNDYGNTWTPRITDAIRTWARFSAAISADGKYQTVGHNGGYIYVSNDYGNTWNAKDSVRGWGAIVISSDGKYQTAIVGGNPGGVWGSNDYGNTWIQKADTSYLYCVSMSSDGKYQYLSLNYISSVVIRSSDYGNTWTTIYTTNSISAIATSADGKFVIVGRQGAQILISNNYGASFVTKSAGTEHYSVAVSDNGKYMAAGVGNVVGGTGGIYFSSDYGNTWKLITPATGTWSVAMSSNGKYILAVDQRSISTSFYIFKTDELIDGNLTINKNLTLPSGDFYSYNATGVNSGEFGLIGWRNNQFVIGSQQSQSGILRDVVITGNNININGSGVLNIFDNTNIVGNLTVTGNTTITSHLSAASKSFLIDHPTQVGKKLQYGSLEGPEHGVFVRGKTNDNIINLPNYWSALVDENSISVNLTPITASNNIYVIDYDNSRVTTNGNNGNYYFYTIYGERKDIPKLTVEF